MSWNDGTRSDIKFPSHYSLPELCTSVGAGDSYLKDLAEAKKQRAYYSRIVQELKEDQKFLGKNKCIEEARFLRDIISENLSLQRAFDFVIKFIEGHTDYFCKFPKNATQELAPYIDCAFNYLCFPPKPPLSEGE